MPEQDRRQSEAEDKKRSRAKDHPQRDEPDTLEGPGGPHEAKDEQDARNSTTRRGER